MKLLSRMKNLTESEMEAQKHFSRESGVTLLEIMLVLAIAAMVIVMSVRYYQSATSSQQTNTVMQQILAVTAAADNLSQGSGTYEKATTANVESVVGKSNLQTPWSGGANPFTITAAAAGGGYTLKVDKLPGSICTAIAAKIDTGSGSHFTKSTCSGTAAEATNNVSIDYSPLPNK